MRSVSDPVDANPCRTCGACCAFFRVSFYWAEEKERGLPSSMIEVVNPFRSCMAGTNTVPSRCVALEGEVGQPVRCTIYEQRPTPCRGVMIGDEKCLRARAQHGLSAL